MGTGSNHYTVHVNLPLPVYQLPVHQHGMMNDPGHTHSLNYAPTDGQYVENLVAHLLSIPADDLNTWQEGYLDMATMPYS